MTVTQLIAAIQAYRSDRFNDAGRFGYIKFPKQTQYEFELARIRDMEKRRRRQMYRALNAALNYEQ